MLGVLVSVLAVTTVVSIIILAVLVYKKRRPFHLMKTSDKSITNPEEQRSTNEGRPRPNELLIESPYAMTNQSTCHSTPPASSQRPLLPPE